MHDNMHVGQLAEVDLAKNEVVMGILDFVQEQLMRIAETFPGSRIIDVESVVAKLKLWLMADGHPVMQIIKATGYPALNEQKLAGSMSSLERGTVQGQIEQYKDSVDALVRQADAKYRYIRAGGGGLHWGMTGWKKGRRLTRTVFLEQIIEGHRNTAAKRDWFFGQFNDPTQTQNESMEVLAAFVWDAARAYESDPTCAGKEFTAVDVINRVERRAAVCPVAYFALLDARFVEVQLSMLESSKNGGNFSLYCAMQRLLMIVLAGTNAHNYIELGVYDRVMWLTESELTKTAYKMNVWLRRTKTGQTCFSDLWVELQIFAIRWYFGKKAGRNLSERLLLFVNEMAGLWQTKGASKNERPNTTTAVQGSFLTTKLFKIAKDKFKLYNINGHGSIDSDIRTKGSGGGTASHACTTQICISGEPMPKGAIDCLLTCTRRLSMLYDERFFNGQKRGVNHFAIIPVSQGDAKELEHTRRLILTTISATIIETGTCKVSGKKLFKKDDIIRMLKIIRDMKQHPLPDGSALDHPTQSAFLEHLTPSHFAKTVRENAQLLANLRGEAKMVEAVRSKRSTAYTYVQGAPSTEAIEHELVHNRIAASISTGGELSASHQELAAALPRYTVGAQSRTAASNVVAQATNEQDFADAFDSDW